MRQTSRHEIGIEPNRREHLVDPTLAFGGILDPGDDQRLRHDVADPKIKIYFELAAEYYDRKNEFRRSNFYLDKKSELEEKTPLLGIGTYVEKLIVQTMIRANPNGPEVTKFLEESSSLISDLKIVDDQLNAELKVLKLLSVETNKRDEVGIKNACIELQKFYAPNHYMSFLLNRLIEQIKDSLNKI